MTDPNPPQQQSPPSTQELAAQYSTLAGKLLTWIEKRLKKSEPGMTFGKPWDPDVEKWLVSDPDGDDDAPPILIGELHARLVHIEYAGYRPDPFLLLDPDPEAVPPPIDSTAPKKFIWSVSARANTYGLQISEDPLFKTVAYEKKAISTTFFDVPAGTLSTGKQYYWRVIALNDAGERQSSPIFSGIKTA